MSEKLIHHDLEIIAGPCSVDERNLSEIYDLATIQVTNMQGDTQAAIWGTRLVGLKSRTSFVPSGKGMGVDWPILEQILLKQATTNIPPSIHWARAVRNKTGLLAATEIMLPDEQLPLYELLMPQGSLMPWNPSVEQLGWPLMKMAIVAGRNKWRLGIKNSKVLGAHWDQAQDPDYEGETELERSWKGLATYAKAHCQDLVLIHRGVSVPDNTSYRNAPVHELARRVKKTIPQALLYLDPSHMLGPNLRDQIVDETINLMQMTEADGWLYDGILIEVGNSTTDTKQHISLDELQLLVGELAKFRHLRAPEKQNHL